MAGRLPSCSLLLCTQSGCCRLCGLDVLGVWLEVALSPSTWRVSFALGLCVATVPHLPPHWLPWSRLLGSPSLALRGSAIGLCLLSLPGTFPGGLYAFCMWYVLEDLKAPFPQKPPPPPRTLVIIITALSPHGACCHLVQAGQSLVAFWMVA